MWAVSAFQGTFQKLLENARGAAVAPNGAQIAFIKDRSKDIMSKSGNEIWLTDADGGNPRLLASSGEGRVFDPLPGLKWSANGQRVAYLARRRNPPESTLESLGRNGGSATVIVSDPRLRNICWTPDNRVLYTLMQPFEAPNSSLWEIRVDAQTGRVSGSPRLVTTWVGFAVLDLQITADGKRLAFVERNDQSDVYAGELEGQPAQLKRARRLTQDDRIDWPGGWMHDSKSLLFFSDRYGNLDILRQRLADEKPDRVVIGADDKRLPQMSSDGAWILYLAWSKADGRASPQTGRLMRAPAAGGAPEFVLEARGYPGSARAPRERGFMLTARGQPDFRCPVALSSSCLLSEIERNQVVFSAFDPIEGRKGETARIDLDPLANFFWDLSPDGSRIAFGQPDVRSGRLHILSLREGSIQDVDVKGWVNLESLCWSADGRQLFVTKHSSSGDSLLSVGLNGAAQVLRKAGMWLERPAASPDGRYLAWGEVSSSSNVWAIDNFR
jgi:Tol biopolymer transport system component